MKFLINIEKKHFYFLSVLIAILTLAVFVYAAVPNPGHPVIEIDWSEIIGVLNVDQICLAGNCQTAWPWTQIGSDIYYNIGNVGIGTITPQSPAPNALPSNLDVNDVYLRSTGGWVSELRGFVIEDAGSFYDIEPTTIAKPACSGAQTPRIIYGFLGFHGIGVVNGDDFIGAVCTDAGTSWQCMAGDWDCHGHVAATVLNPGQEPGKATITEGELSNSLPTAGCGSTPGYGWYISYCK